MWFREVKVTESSESVLAGTKRPPFRMVVRATDANGSRMDIRPAVSEEFVVVTKRTKNLKKQEIPSLDDPISKLNHIGKETVKKLNEIKASADEMNLDLKLPRELWRYAWLLESNQVNQECKHGVKERSNGMYCLCIQHATESSASNCARVAYALLNVASGFHTFPKQCVAVNEPYTLAFVRARFVLVC